MPQMTGEELRARRLAADLRQVDLAVILKRDQSLISHMERGDAGVSAYVADRVTKLLPTVPAAA